MGTGSINRDAVQVQDKSASYERRLVRYTGSASYATGGETFNPEAIGLKTIVDILGLTIWNGTTLYWGHWDSTNKKIIFYSATGTEVPNGTVLSAFTGTFEVNGQ